MYRLTITILLIFGILIAACVDSKKAEVNPDPADYLAQKFDQIGIERVSEVQRFVGQSLYEYIDGGAEVYHLYKFVEVVTASYKDGETEIVADIYRFTNDDMAYGMFSTLRPPSTPAIKLGVEGFNFGSSLDFVKGNYIIRLTGYDETPETATAITKLSQELNNLIPGKTTKPEMFSIFPLENQIEYTDRIYAESFLGRKALTDVYCLDFQLDSDTVTLFIANDEQGGKFKQWFESIEYDEANMKAAKSLPYDQPKAMIFEDDYYGTIAAGMKKGKLIGMINYKDKYKSHLTDWLNSFN